MSESPVEDFSEATVAGFDIGSKSVGLWVREGKETTFTASHVFNGQNETLEDRRKLRRQKRTKRSRRARLDWLKECLDRFGFPDPTREPGEHNPIKYRDRALNGEDISKEEMSSALYHLANRRGDLPEVPWETSRRSSRDSDDGPEITMEDAEEKRNEKNDDYYAYWLLERQKNDKHTRKIVFDRQVIEAEFKAILDAQREQFPALYENQTSIMYGDISHEDHEIRDGIHVWMNRPPRECGLFSAVWPKFDNRGPGIDLANPFREVDGEYYINHVARRDCETYRNFQREQRIYQLVYEMGLIDRNTGELKKGSDIPEEVIVTLRNLWQQLSEEFRETHGSGSIDIDRKSLESTIREGWGLQFPAEWDDLTVSRDGRAQFSRPTMKKFVESYKQGQKPDYAPVIKPPHMNPDEAIKLLLRGVNDPMIEHRLRKLDNMIQEAEEVSDGLDYVVVELPRGLRSGDQQDSWQGDLEDYFPNFILSGEKPTKKSTNQWDDKKDWWELDPRARNEAAYEFLQESEDKGLGLETVTGKQIRALTMMMEQHFQCIYCGQALSPSQLDSLNDEEGSIEIDHVVPQSVMNDDSYNNTVVSCWNCNQKKEGRVPDEWFSQTESQQSFTGYKNRVDRLITDNNIKRTVLKAPRDEAIDALESRRPGARTGYINNFFRKISLIRLGWLNKSGEDREQIGADNQKYMTTDGPLTAQLRHHWGFNEIPEKLYPKANDPSGLYSRDARNHAVDAAIVASTLPWYHSRGVDYKQNDKWAGAVSTNADGSVEIDNPVDITPDDVLVKINEPEDVVVHHQVGVGTGSVHTENLYGKRTIKKDGEEHTIFVKREDVTGKTRKQLGNKVFPPDLGIYLQKLLDHYNKQNDRKNDADPIQGFVEQTMYRNYQKWRDSAEEIENRDKQHVRLLSEYPENQQKEIKQSPIKKVYLQQGGNFDCVDKDSETYKEYDEYQDYIVVEKPNGNYRLSGRFKDGDLQKPPTNDEQVATTFRKGDIIELTEIDRISEGCYRITGAGVTNNSLYFVPIQFQKNTIKVDEEHLQETYGFNSHGRNKRSINTIMENLVK